MNILFVTSTYTPSVNGVSVSIQKYYEFLTKLGHDVMVLAPSPISNKAEVHDDPNIVRYPSTINPMVEDYPIPIVPISIDRFREVRNKKFDVVHAHHPYHIGYFAENYASRSDAVYVMTHHTRYSDYSEIYLKYLPKSIQNRIMEMSVEDFFAKANVVFTPSDAIKSELLKSMPFIEAEKMPTGITVTGRSRMSKAELRKKLDLPDNKKILLSLSRLGKEKNLDLVLESMKLLPNDFFLVIVGGGPNRSNLEKKAKTLNIDDRVRFVGRVKHEDVGEYYEASDLFLMPSLTETQGLTLLEAQYFGLVPISVDCKVNREWTAPDGGVLVDNEVKMFVDSIQKTFPVADQMSPIAMKWTDQYTMDNLAKKLEAKYEELIERKNLSLKLTSYGWQSWSTSDDSLLKIPRWNFPPTKDKTLVSNPNTYLKKKESVRGWCSWYAFERDITEENIVSQAEFISRNREKYPLDYILIDDGWCKWGDWDRVDEKKFPNGLKTVYDKVNSLGLKNGIWMAPFMAMTDSKLVNQHPEWVVKYMGRPINAIRVLHRLDSFSPVFRYMLDVRNPDVIDYLHNVINEIVDKNNIQLLKLDNLYTHYYYPGMSKNEANWILSNFYKRIRKENPELHLLACGTPLKPALGYVDSMRVGPDTFTVSAYKVPIGGRVFNSDKVKQSVQKVRGMMWTQKYWNVDPDVFVCRDELNFTDRLIKYHRNMVIDVVDNGGNLWLGDDLTKLQDGKWDRYVKRLFRES